MSNSLQAQDAPNPPTDQIMSTYVIERTIEGAGELSKEELKVISQGSCAAIKEIGPQIKWLHSYVTTDKVFCVYKAADEALLLEHAKIGGFPIDAVHRLAEKISPQTAED